MFVVTGILQQANTSLQGGQGLTGFAVPCYEARFAPALFFAAVRWVRISGGMQIAHHFACGVLTPESGLSLLDPRKYIRQLAQAHMSIFVPPCTVTNIQHFLLPS